MASVVERVIADPESEDTIEQESEALADTILAELDAAGDAASIDQQKFDVMLVAKCACALHE